MSLGPRVLFLMVKYLLRFRIKRLMSVSIQGGEAVFLFCSLSWDKHVDSGLDVVFECLPCCLYITSPRNILVMVEVLNVVPKAIPCIQLSCTAGYFLASGGGVLPFEKSTLQAFHVFSQLNISHQLSSHSNI